MRSARTFVTLAFTVASTMFLAAACGDDEATSSSGPGGGGGSGGSGGTGGTGSGICLLHNCESDDHCGGCSEGRNYCLVAEKRCVACGNGTTGGCPEGMECSSYGLCVPEGLECPTDAQGNPTFECANSGDCAACAPDHLVCDPVSHACVACTENDTAECQATDICVEGKCSPACSANCQADADCGKCPGAKACNAHKCSECGPTYACKAGEVCHPNGTCQRECGISGTGSCNTNAECAGCENATTCHIPLNGGIGTCGPTAPGCSDLGQGTVVLPDPWNDYTNTCSNDGDCAGVGAQYNIGKALRELTGFDQIDDADITYGMNVCAAVNIGSTSCGICVPCRVDADCDSINIDAVAADAFGPVGSLAAALLLNLVFGNNSHTVYMYCETVAAGYGVCVPCPGLLNNCAIGGGGGGGGGSCSHSPETTGGALDSSCGSCEAEVCAVDSYCCDGANGEWDDVCVDEAATLCSTTCHDECDPGDALDPSCGACASDVCDFDDYCCTTNWDSICIDEAVDICGIVCN